MITCLVLVLWLGGFPRLITVLPIVLSVLGLFHGSRVGSEKYPEEAERRSKLALHYGVFACCITGMFAVIGLLVLRVVLSD